ncbi:hypothetical protein GK047_18000 [Paenibacillus sp. SYP-B3998]|uniref:Uncharacterized protein n=1 Tax=Paenibacillus sp. SYP-B3998 TaxID=2678564 RepID=A0A6G4A0J7_9BACL|nr:hypothetical protein [Paenibacillus sp. SYP-B3998]NEW07895.1 hypothetical protein [Paenibacillus sp. SYP-B3998]
MIGMERLRKANLYSLPAPTTPSLFELGNVEDILVESVIGDVTDLEMLKRSLKKANPEIVDVSPVDNDTSGVQF